MRAIAVMCPAAVAAPVAQQAQRDQPPRSRPRSRKRPTEARPAKPERAAEVRRDGRRQRPPRREEKLVNAPSTMSVITENQIKRAPSQNFAELLRSVPGVNITQVSARDINVTSRGSTGTLATGQLALLDGRSLYQDFFGFVMWDFLPVNLNEVKQVEVIRGPASAVWGANALNGVVNVITKSPREMQGTSAVLGFGTLRSRQTATDCRARSWYVSGTHAAAINDRWAYKLSAGGVLAGRALATDRRDPLRLQRRVQRTAGVVPGFATRAARSRSSTPASTTTSPTAASCRSRAASPAPTA